MLEVNMSLSKYPPRAKKRSIPVVESSKQDDYVYKYSCAMLNLSPQVGRLIREWAEKHIPIDRLYVNEDYGIDGYEYTPHVTIKYGLHDITPDNLIKLVDGCGPIKLLFGKVTKFDSNPEFDVIKISIAGDKLIKLNNLISDNLVNTDEYDEYSPHATIAYVKKGSCDELISNDFFDKLVDMIDVIYFTSRTGEEHYISL